MWKIIKVTVSLWSEKRTISFDWAVEWA